jgi:hypothetical protein
MLLTWPNGAVISSGERSLMSYGIASGNLLMLENAAANKSKPIQVHFVVHLKSDSEDMLVSRNDALRSVSVTSSSTIAEIKAAMIQLLVSEAADEFGGERQFRLRRLNFMKELQAILQDEQRTLDEVDIYDQDLVCLEEGRVPVAGELTLYVQCYEYVTPDKAAEQIRNLCVAFEEQAQNAEEASSIPVDLDALSTQDTNSDSAPDAVEQQASPSTTLDAETNATDSTSTDAEAPKPKPPPPAFEMYSPALFR